MKTAQTGYAHHATSTLGPLDEPLAIGTLDVLIVDKTGKEFSGSYMDPNITGRPSR